MNAKVVEELAMYVLSSSCYNSSGNFRVTKNMLKDSSLGDVFSAERNNACGRAVHEEELKVIYKDSSGVACVLSVTGTTDSPNPEYCEEPDMIIWFRFLD